LTRRLWFSAIAAVFAIGACDRAVVSPERSITGVWNLSTFDGVPLPHVLFQSGADTIRLESDVFAILPSGRFSRTLSGYQRVGGVVTSMANNEDGAYTVDGSSIEFRFDSQRPPLGGTWMNDTLILTETGSRYVYVR
jgi:hypothetical protein